MKINIFHKFIKFFKLIWFDDPTPIKRIRRRRKIICRKCFHKCHCDDELHADRYGLCTCMNCICGKKSKNK